MNTKLFFSLIVVFGLSITTAVAQSDINELLSRLDANHMGSITDVFTKAELEQIRLYKDAEYGISGVPVPEGGGKEFFSPENVNMNFGHFEGGDPGNFNILGASGTADFDGAAAYNPASGNFMAIDNAGNAYSVTTGGTYNLLGTVSPPPGENFTGLEYHPINNELFGISSDGAGSTSLSRINTATLDVEVIGSTGLQVGIALGFDLSGAAYSYDIDDDNLYRINKTNGNATKVGPIGFDASFGQGMALNRATGNLYMSAFNNGPVRSEFRMVNTTTGMTTFMGVIGGTSPGGTLQFAWTSIFDPDLSVIDETFFNLMVYPNPATDRINISANQSIETLAVYNTLGQLVMQTPFNRLAGTLDVTSLTEGLYILEVHIGGDRDTYSFVKQ